MIRLRSITLVNLFILFIFNCSVNPRFNSNSNTNKTPPPPSFSGRPSSSKIIVKERPKGIENFQVLKTIHGVSSWYGPKFHGKPTATGEKYNMNLPSAAHKDLPLHTWIRVTNIKNNKSIIVRINDRGPYIKGRILDLSYKAAIELEFENLGLADVKIEVLQYGPQKKR